MNRNFEPTILPYNRVNKNDMGELSFDSISIKKSLIDSLCSVEDLDYNLLFLAAVCITLTKYTNNTSIFIHVNNIPLIFNSNNRKETVIDYIKIIEEYLSHPVSSKNKESYFNFIYNGGEDKEDYNISLSLFEESQLYILKLKFDSSRYTHSYINSFLRSIKKVINQFINKGIDKLKIENILLRCENKVPEFKLLRNPLVNELLEAQSIKTPDKIALRVSGEAYTFKQINDESNNIANGLLKRGFKKGDSVSFMLPRNKTLITSFLGIIKAGCVAIPLDMNYPLERINYIKQNSDSKFIITYESIEGGINPDDLINEGDPIFPDVQLKADDPIFILYTSGSTGNPKGVISKHCGISNLTATHIKNNYEKLLSITSIAFDISEEDILISFTSGKELIFANDDEIEDILLLSCLIEKTKPEFVNLTPSRLLSYLQVPEFANSIKHLKGIGCGGEKFTGNVYDIIKKYADIDIYNGYGPLETSLTSNSKKITNSDYITNGKPLKNYITDVRDIDGKLLPYGVIGELYIGGLGVSKGYYKMEDKTKKTFISINDVPYYKTGDYAVQLPSDEIIIKGRVDNQIKLRGQRVELEEIEQVISKFPNIENAIATVYELNHEKHLCAYFTSQINIKIDDLIDYLSSTLSAFMIPTFLIQLEEFPQTPNGKIDRKLLPKPKMDIENVKPNSSLEKTLYCFCTKILNQNYFGVTDNLFKLGFTSITLMKLNSYIFHEFNISLKHTDLMNNPTIREISDALENKSSIDDIKKIVPSDSNKYPMSSQQKRLYVIYCQYPNLTNYNLPNLIKLEKPINVKRLEKAINHVIDCEEILRTSFHIENGEYIQKIHNNRRIKLDLIKVKDDIEEVIRQNIRPFNLESEPLIRIKVIEFKGETYIFRDMHHIIGDQISNDLLYDKIKDSYNNKPISTSEIQYKDYVFWLKKQQVKQADFWRNMNISDSGSQLFADFKRPLIQSFNGNKISSNIDKNLIVKVAKENNTTIYKLLLLQFVVLLHKYTNESFIQIGTLTSGRTHPNLEETLGMFVNTLPFIQDILVDKTLKENLIITEEILSGIFENQDYSIEQIIDEYKLSTANSYNPLFNILFIQNTANDFDNRLDVDELKFDLTCTVKNSSSDLIIEFEYNQDLYSFEKIHNLLNHYIYLINNIEENMNKKIRDIKILSPLEEDNIIKMSGSNDDFDSNSILSELNTQIDKNPTQVILSDDKTDLRYAEFDLKTNSLANYLHDNFDIKKQDNIIVIAKRSIESVLAFYSILKLNGVYIPINPFAPKNRIKHIVNQTNPKVILTNLDLDLDNINIVNLNQKLLYDYDDSKIESTCEGNLCILHTSGTTGVPKGVIISHKNVEKFLINAKNKFYNTNTKIFYHTTNIGFDTSLFEIIYSIVYGIQLYIINENYDFSKIPKDILYSKSMINTVPSKLNMFFTLPNFDDVMKNTYQLILAGEALNENLVRDIRKKYNPIIYNGYGPCETTIFASIKEISSTNKVTIGKPNLNTHIYILNNDKQLCPIGIPGELCIGGKQVSAGYLDKNETKHHFINNLFGNDIIYCTGDLAYLDFDGELNFIGRKDSQIKINGQRIELEEVNKAIENYGNIIQAVTIPNSNKTQLYSYLVSEEIIDIDELFKYLETILLPFMIPTSIMQIDSIPLSNNGKININKLPEPEFINDNYIAPTNDIEKSIVKVWENVLDVKKIGINDNFYYLGGDSIKAIRIISILQNKGFFVQYNDILNYKTPYLIAQNIEKKPQVTYDSIKGIIDLLPIQNYFFDQINRNDYTQEFILESKKDLNINLLQKSFDELTNLHDMLRASFKIENNKPVQEILPLNSRVSEINEFKIKDDLKNNMEEIIKDRKNSINVFNKLIDISLIHHNDKTFLIFIIHHLIIDGISWGILLDDLSHIYSQLESEYNSNLFTTSYDNYFENFRLLDNFKFNMEDDNWLGKNVYENNGEGDAWLESNVYENYTDKTIVCPLSESQLAIYLDEKTNNKGTAYSVSRIIDCDMDKSVDEIKNAIWAVINKRHILKARITHNEISPLLVCDASLDINVIHNDDTENYIKEFDLEESLTDFYIINKDERKAIFVNIHYIIIDATSMQLIEKDLIAALDGNLDETVDLAFVNDSYHSYKSQFNPKYNSAHEFYSKKLADIGQANTLERDIDGTQGFVSLPIQGVKKEVEDFIESHGITVGSFLNAVFAYTLSRFTGSNNVYYNFTEHGRHEDYLQNACGMFAKTIPLLVDCQNDNIVNYLKNFSYLSFDSVINSIYPFRLLASEFNLNNNILFEYNYNLNDTSYVKDDLIISELSIDPVSDILCTVNDLDDGYLVNLYHSEKYSRNTAIRFVEAYAKILTEILTKENLADIDYVSIKDLNLLNKINNTDYILEYEDILDVFNFNLSKYPNNTLVSFNDKQYNNGEVAFISRKIAKYLIDLGIEKNDNVAFLVEPSPLCLFNILAILSIGAIYVPLDTAHPDSQLEFILNDTESKVIIVSDDTYRRVKTFNNNCKIFNISEIFNEDIKTLQYLPIVYNDLACILYTSGTTGHPKGVKIRRKALLNLSTTYVNKYDLNKDDTFGLFSSIGFDMSNFIISAVIYSGACLVVIPKSIKLNMLKLNDFFINHNVTHSFITTQVAKLFMKSIESTSLKILLVAGEKLGEFSSPDDYLLVDAYGPTEAFAFNSSIINDDKIDSSSVGFLNYNTKAYILDNEFRPVPIGAVGELYLAGYQVAEAYLNREKESGESFIDNPFDEDPDYSKLYRTGDMMRILSDGSLAIIGRCDSQIKVRGNRVELSEIESSIRQIDHVRDVTVQSIRNKDNAQLIAYVVADSLDEETIKNHILKHKPNYMVPSFVMFLDEIPLTVNSKIDLEALPLLDLSNFREDYVAPENNIEKEIINVFEYVFNQKGIGLNDDFIQLGGDSISSIRIISLLNKKGISCSATDILNYKTPYLIAQNSKSIIKTLDSEDYIDYETYELKNNMIYPNFRQSNQLKFIRPYSYKNWVEDVKNLVENISPDEKQHWIEINGLLDDLKIKGKSISFNFNVNVDYRTDNLLMLSEEEYLALAIARAYKKTYGKDIIFNRESYGRDESIASIHRTIGWFTSQYPVFVNISTMYDDISIMRDVYNLKTAFRNISNFGLNYSSLVYFTHDFKYKHCPVTFNFLSTEFIFENELFKSVNEDFDLNDEGNREVYGVDFNINRVDDIYYIIGDYPQDTFIGEEISLFFDNIRFELDFIANFYFEDNNIICNLSQPQLEVYYNEINQDLGTAYSTWDKIECPNDKSINQIKEAIFTLIDKHPILKGRILDDGLFPLLICDSYPLIETRYDDDFSNLIREFDLKKYLARFYIIDKDNSKFVFYDIHHIINDAMGFNIVKNDLIAGLEGKLNKNPDLGFVYGSKDSFESQFEPFYKSAHEFYKMQFKEIDNVNTIEADLNGSRGMVSLPIREIRNKVEKFTFDNNITVGTFLNAVFAYSYACFIGKTNIYYNFVEHGRHETYMQNALGMYALTIPILVNCKNDKIKNYLSYFSNLVFNSMSNHVYPYRLLREEFNLNNNVLFEYNFDLNDVSNIYDKMIVRDIFIEKDVFSEFFCIINDLDDGYVIHIKHGDMFTNDTAISFVKLFSRILNQMLINEYLEDIMV